MKREESNIELKNAKLMTSNDMDDVFDNVLDLLSIRKQGAEVNVIVFASFIDIKPYIAVKVCLRNMDLKGVHEEISCFVEDDNVLLFNKHFAFNNNSNYEQIVEVKMNVMWVDPDGQSYHAQKTIEANIASIPFEEIHVSKPRANDHKRTKVLYETYTRGDTYDYEYPSNKRIQNTVKALLPLKGTVLLGDEWHPESVITEGVNAPKLYMLLSTGDCVAFKKECKDLFW